LIQTETNNIPICLRKIIYPVLTYKDKQGTQGK
jgi:hypothetical protein